MKYSEIQTWLWNVATETAKDWHKRQCRDAFGRFYLYHALGRLCAMQEGVDDLRGWELATPERISPAWTVDQTAKWIVEKAQRLPVVPV